MLISCKVLSVMRIFVKSKNATKQYNNSTCSKYSRKCEMKTKKKLSNLSKLGFKTLVSKIIYRRNNQLALQVILQTTLQHNRTV